MNPRPLAAIVRMVWGKSRPFHENWWQVNGFFESRPKIPERHEIIYLVFINPNPNGAFTKLDGDINGILVPRNRYRNLFGYFQGRLSREYNRAYEDIPGFVDAIVAAEGGGEAEKKDLTEQYQNLFRNAETGEKLLPLDATFEDSIDLLTCFEQVVVMIQEQEDQAPKHLRPLAAPRKSKHNQVNRALGLGAEYVFKRESVLKWSSRMLRKWVWG